MSRHPFSPAPLLACASSSRLSSCHGIPVLLPLSPRAIHGALLGWCTDVKYAEVTCYLMAGDFSRASFYTLLKGCWSHHWLLDIVLMDVQMPGLDGIWTPEVLGGSLLQSALVRRSLSDEVHTRIQAQEPQGSWRGVGPEKGSERGSLKPPPSQARREQACTDRSRPETRCVTAHGERIRR